MLSTERGKRLRTLCLAAMAVMLLVGAGCRQKMSYQPRYDPLERTDSFENKASSRPLVAGTVPRGYLRENPEVFLGRKATGEYVTEFPFQVTEAVMNRGKERYTIYCTMCHGFTGHGNGMIVQRGFSKPPDFHTDETRNKAIGYYFSVITNGYGAMPSHAHQIPVSDRWAIVAYLRALQLSQNARVDDVPTDKRSQLDAPAKPAESHEKSSHSEGAHK
jgi:mono/diheme cytochrome c family protein